MQPEMIYSIVTGLIVAVPNIIATFVSYKANSKENEENKNLTIYRIDQLEEKVSKHNQLVERTYKLEGQMEEVQHDVAEIKSKIK